MKIAIFGAGNSGCATAVDLVLKGFNVALCSAYAPEHLRPTIEKGGLECSGELGKEFVRIKATNSVKEAVDACDIVIISTPSSIHEYYAKLLAPYLNTGLVLLNCCTTGGALNVSTIFRNMGVSDPRVCETDISAYICRLQSSTHVKIFHRINHRLFSCFPAKYNDESYEVVREIYPEIELVENVLETSLSNLNAIIHPPGMVLNAGWIESTKGGFFFYSQGITPAIARIIEQVDNERLSILSKIGLRQIGLAEHLHRYGLSPITKGSVYKAIQASEPLRSIWSPTSFNHRYLLEDVGYGLLPMASIARQIDVRTPMIDSLISLACILNEVNHWETGLTAEKLGIAGTDMKKLKEYLYEGAYR